MTLMEQALKGALAGLVGGVVFGFWMAGAGVLPMVARLVGGSSEALGFAVHLGNSATIGAAYGVVSHKAGARALPGILWGLVYGFVWYFLGPLTLMPLMLGMGVQWTAAAVAGTLPSLYWHLVYGGVTGLVFSLLRYISFALLNLEYRVNQAR